MALLEKHRSIYVLCWSSSACRTTDEGPVLNDTRDVPRVPLRVCLTRVKPSRPRVQPQWRFMFSRLFVCCMITLLCFFVSSKMCTYTHTAHKANRYCTEKIQPCMHTHENTHTWWCHLYNLMKSGPALTRQQPAGWAVTVMMIWCVGGEVWGKEERVHLYRGVVSPNRRNSLAHSVSFFPALCAGCNKQNVLMHESLYPVLL